MTAKSFSVLCAEPPSDLLWLLIAFEEGDPRALPRSLLAASRPVGVAVPLPLAAVRKRLTALFAEVLEARATEAFVLGLVVLVGLRETWLAHTAIFPQA